ncbi:hypothetical protein MES4922_40200 [Mesorhizobium ventifaucium]|uniref:Uncharacterized protein n=1 Tax=Mesorhizobium ventifaucium TaxID=666020 RepID=A0ABM9E8A1_9HYPH|nr:hypothetical protein MES4922_40200 [Mesorhizobium ventifaucium]
MKIGSASGPCWRSARHCAAKKNHRWLRSATGHHGARMPQRAIVSRAYAVSGEPIRNFRQSRSPLRPRNAGSIRNFRQTFRQTMKLGFKPRMHRRLPGLRPTTPLKRTMRRPGSGRSLVQPVFPRTGVPMPSLDTPRSVPETPRSSLETPRSSLDTILGPPAKNLDMPRSILDTPVTSSGSPARSTTDGSR